MILSNLIIPLQSCLAACMSNNHAFAMWSKPHEEHFEVIVDKNPATLSAITTNSDQGFILNPFHSKAFTHAYFIKAQWHINTAVEEDVKRLSETYPNIASIPFSILKNNTSTSTHKVYFQNQVEQALANISKNEFKKVVLARCESKEHQQDLKIVATALELRHKYAHAFVSLCYHPHIGCWIGASPELLASMNKEGIFKTISLAGTQKLNSALEVKSHTWSHKEIEEQALVTRYIINCFKNIRLREYEEVGPRNFLAGNLVHLCSTFKINEHEVEQKNLIALLTPLLHPTSATCGEPKEKALEFIQQHEDFDRALYSGFIGPLNMNQETHLYVNLRCAQVFKNHLLSYAGAGITEESIPDKEWEETSEKLKTIQQLFA